MRRVCLYVLACAIAMSPAAAYPQEGPQLHMAALSDLPGAAALTTNEALMIGLGVVVGAVAGSSLIPLESGTLIGAIGGGVIGDWWYMRAMNTEYQQTPSGKAR